MKSQTAQCAVSRGIARAESLLSAIECGNDGMGYRDQAGEFHPFEFVYECPDDAFIRQLTEIAAATLCKCSNTPVVVIQSPRHPEVRFYMRPRFQ